MKVILLSMTLMFPSLALYANEPVEDKQNNPWNCIEGTGGEETPADFSRFCEMEARDRQEVRDSFQLARALYGQGKYGLCLEQLNNVKSKITRFENSDELRDFCNQGNELLRVAGELEPKDSIRRAPSAIEKIKKSN